MKNIRRFFSILLSIALILSFVPLECIAAEKVVSDDVVEYSVPLVSMEMPENAISFYEIAGDYYLNLKDIATLTRCTYEEKNNIILLTHGTRELEINIETSELNDSGIKEQGKIKLKEYEGAYLCEAVPMLNYLGAECSINDQLNAFQVLMPTITFWEAFMPDYLDYHFNTEEWMGNQTDVEISLICDIIMDLLDVTNGHGLYSTDEHYEDALYDILNVDLYSYESVQTIVEKENNKMEEFLCSDTFSNVFSQGSEIGQKIFEGYADYYMTAKIAVDEVNRTNQFIKGNYEVAADIGQQINKNICKQVDLQTVGKNSVGAATLAFDTALSAYKLMCYDEESRTLFSTCITDDVEKFTGYDVEYLQKITDKISSDIKTDQSIVANVVVDKISKWAYSEIKDKGVETAASAFKGGNIYVLAAKVGVMLAEIPLRGTIDAYSDDMDMLWLASTQTDVAQLATRYMLTTLRDEKGNNAEHIEMVKNLMALYYRTTIAFCENAISSCEEFGSAKTKAKTCEYLKQVSDYMATYLYLMTNCKVVPIVEFSELSDDILTIEWLEDHVDYANSFYEKLVSDLGCADDYIATTCITVNGSSSCIVPKEAQLGIIFKTIVDFDNNGVQDLFVVTLENYEGELKLRQRLFYFEKDGSIAVNSHSNSVIKQLGVEEKYNYYFFMNGNYFVLVEENDNSGDWIQNSPEDPMMYHIVTENNVRMHDDKIYIHDFSGLNEVSGPGEYIYIHKDFRHDAVCYTIDTPTEYYAIYSRGFQLSSADNKCLNTEEEGCNFINTMLDDILSEDIGQIKPVSWDERWNTSFFSNDKMPNNYSILRIESQPSEKIDKKTTKTDVIIYGEYFNGIDNKN